MPSFFLVVFFQKSGNTNFKINFALEEVIFFFFQLHLGAVLLYWQLLKSNLSPCLSAQLYRKSTCKYNLGQPAGSILFAFFFYETSHIFSALNYTRWRVIPLQHLLAAQPGWSRQQPFSSLLSDQAAHVRAKIASRHTTKNGTVSQFKENMRQNNEDQNGINSSRASAVHQCLLQ